MCSSLICMGGGIFDVSILEITEDRCSTVGGTHEKILTTEWSNTLWKSSRTNIVRILGTTHEHSNACALLAKKPRGHCPLLQRSI